MIKNYFKTAFRNLWRNKTFSVIKILGLGIGLAVCMLIFPSTKDELSYDQFPVGYHFVFVHKWLENFAYRINIAWWMFGLAGAVVITIALVTISFQAMKAAVASPMKSLRTE